MKKTLVIIFISHLCLVAITQEQTVGLLSYKKHDTAEGYTLIYPRDQSSVFLLNNCGEIVHQWDDDDIYVPNNAVYLLDNGNLVKCKKHNNGFIGAGGGEYFIEMVSWENEHLWSYDLNTTTERLHHDVEILPNGNILMIAWEQRTREEAMAYGRLPEYLEAEALYPDYIFEINPETNDKVWEWHAWDHLIQDIDSTKFNYGSVAAHPELIDINYVEHTGSNDWDWMHVNAVDYHPGLDHIMICVPYFNEVWIIDHSTTTEEAASHSGGTSGMGGDILYRVGNPLAYKMGTEEDKILFFPHDTHWANNFLEPDHPNYDKILIFNNRGEGDISKMEIFDNPWNQDSLKYSSANGIYQPTAFDNSITHPTPTDFFSSGLSGVQALPNGNFLGCSGGQGYLMEITPDNEIVWEYKVPIKLGNRVPQGTFIDYFQNLTFRAFKYPSDYSAFNNRDLSSKGFIELNPNISFCDSLTSVNHLIDPTFKVFPNPASTELNLSWSNTETKDIKIFDLLGQEMVSLKTKNISKTIDISSFQKGIYIVIYNQTNKVLFVAQ